MSGNVGIFVDLILLALLLIGLVLGWRQGFVQALTRIIVVVAALLLAAEAGVDVVDCAISSMAGMTSQPSLNAVVAAMKDTERDTGLDLDRLQTLTDYWEDVRKRYDSFEGGLEYNTTDIYRYEIPGGQYTNLQPQVESLGLGHRFEEVKEMYKTVNDMLGDPVKVTPSSKVVGDLAIFMVQNDLTPENFNSVDAIVELIENAQD